MPTVELREWEQSFLVPSWAQASPPSLTLPLPARSQQEALQQSPHLSYSFPPPCHLPCMWAGRMCHVALMSPGVPAQRLHLMRGPYCPVTIAAVGGT